MGMELSKGDIFITMGDETTKFASGALFTEDEFLVMIGEC